MVIKSELACIYMAKNGRSIMPGNNIIPDAEAKLILSTPHARGLVKAGKLSVNSIEKATEEKQKKSNATSAEKTGTKAPARTDAIEKAVAELIEDYDAPNACIIVEETLDLVLLNAMKAEEKRSGVLKAIDRQIKFVNAEPEDEI